MSSLLSNLPLELLRHIISFLGSKACLCNLALCSRQFYSFTLPYLYEHVELYNQEVGKKRDKCTDLRSLASLLFRKPEVARMVRRFTIRDELTVGRLSKRKEISDEERPRTMEVNDELRHAVKTTSHSKEEEREWLKHLSWVDHADSIVALLLPSLIRLQSLDLMLSTSPDYVKRMLRRVSRKERPFDQFSALNDLSDIMHSSYWWAYGIDLTFAATCLGLPSIRRLFGYCITSGLFTFGDEVV